MRRLRIIFYWLFKSHNNVSLIELIRFTIKPKVKAVASRFIKDISLAKSLYKINFNVIEYPLYWPKEYSIDGIYQVTSETFDNDDWHYYQKKNTIIEHNEILLDVGAAEGLFALSVADKCNQIIMIEPNDHFAKALKTTFQPFDKKTTIYNVAVGSAEGTIAFNQTSLSGKVDLSDNESVQKSITTVDKIIGDTPITYLKADIEGHELEMLKGAIGTIKKNKPKIVITCYHRENIASEIIDFIKSIVPEYNHYVKGVFHEEGKPVMIHFWKS
ncbi:methyltransferase, FkbM family [Ohtaekwangia koreensis]|uniref:Methyltransferase, FkbM family n=1 Tax=Ohtaekwangia koreensis TaxID=688867 RepID=A0A1T5IH60_9BACT|nr:methyltransferase, FkbM family [Ohtaekwangia koreensis]